MPNLTYLSYKCIKCGTCVGVCPQRALLYDEERGLIRINRDLCNVCGTCTKYCPTTAIRLVGKEMTVRDVMNEVEKDIPFYDASGGGVTFGGGEPLAQPTFLVELLKECQARKIHTAIETSGYAPPRVFRKIVELADLLLYDIKLVDEGAHIKYTGVSNRLILANLLYVNSVGKQIIIRIPVIPCITDTHENVDGVLRTLRPLNLGSVLRVDLLPYHDVREKYERLGLEYKMPSGLKISQERINYIKERIEELGLKVTIGGPG